MTTLAAIEHHHVVPPRGLSAIQASAYIGVSIGKFREMVEDGRMPRARKIDRRLVWDRLELDDAFAALPHEGGSDLEEEDVWASVAV